MRGLALLAAVLWMAAIGCGAKVAAEAGGGGPTGGTFPCGDTTCQQGSEYCIDIPPLQPPPQGDGIEAWACGTLAAGCTTCACVPSASVSQCLYGVASCGSDGVGNVMVTCYPQ